MLLPGQLGGRQKQTHKKMIGCSLTSFIHHGQKSQVAANLLSSDVNTVW